MDVLASTHILLVDVSVPPSTRDAWISGGALSVNCIDHHQSAIADWPADKCPIQTNHCAALQAFSIFFPTLPIPSWLHSIDRMDRWENVTYEDRCLRELLSIIAHKPVQKMIDEAIRMTEEFMYLLAPAYVLQIGKSMLEMKDAELMKIISKGKTFCLTDEHLAKWGLNPSWLNKKLFIMDTTDITLDSSEAGHLVFLHQPEMDVFINYRKKVFYAKDAKIVKDAKDAMEVVGKKNYPKKKTMFVYSLRSQTFDVTESSIFKGHSTSAGVSLIVGDAPIFPFLLE
jgi:hypothetical protein